MAGGVDGSGRSQWTPAQVNSIRISSVVDRLSLHVSPTGPKEDASKFFDLCLSLARGIDYALANNEVPGKAQDLPKLLKKVCQCKTQLLQAAIMVLLVSVKAACKTGWFSNEDSKDLLTLADEVACSFFSIGDMITEASDPLQAISTIIARFYPHLKMGQTLSSLKLKPGYVTYLTDFHIPKNIKLSGEEIIRLFVAQTDNIETSSCLISPPQANFLINGKGVDRRTNVLLESGPLLPTIITPMLKYGTNILQVVGQLSGNYVIVVAFMSVISGLDSTTLQNYVPPEVAVQDQDSELVEGPSRISLNCPISFKRIKTPVKGHSCKHIQYRGSESFSLMANEEKCFDFDNFVGINSRRPFWRCPHCNQCVSYADIRVDQYMTKILKEVEEDVSEVIISADGSWKPVTKPSSQEDLPAQQKASNCSNGHLDLMDLTKEDDDMDKSIPMEIQDVKPILADISNHFEAENATVSPIMNNPNVVSQNNDNHVESDFWSRMFLSTYPPQGPGPRSQPQMFGDVSGSVASNMQAQQSQSGNPVASNEYGTNPRVTRPRVERAVQALPVQPQISSVPQQLLLSQNNTSAMGDGLKTNYSTTERQLRRLHLSSLQSSHTHSSLFSPVHVSPMNLFQFQQQNRNHQINSSISSPPAQPTIPPPTLPSTSPRLSPHMATEHQNFRQHAATSTHHRATSPVPLPGGGIRSFIREQRANTVARSSSSARPEMNNWKPTGRMRGALQGEAYSQALQQFIFQPAQPVQATMPPTLPVSSLNTLLANNRNAHATDPPSTAATAVSATSVPQ